ncbi:hypothetical protein KX928_20065 [Roseobacter sp. YSTF-M11]|uniref:Uncharacterized protein n=1 Tax=Roseobacter insulae TaxID=2859783 RepID=A0A9X1FZ86_9RHOB|nr:hypothetical protein [Roseobacter insulae]MBW4710087.1 hypothetical protein [Roseobacter insulae]
MPDSGLEDATRLAGVLAGLATVTDDICGPGRRISRGGAGQVQKAILQEIDETVLRRQVMFTNDRGGVVALDVAERRVLRVSDSQSAGTAPPSSLGNASFLTGEDADAVARTLEAFSVSATDVHVRTALISDPIPAGVIGVSSHDLSRHLLGETPLNAQTKTVETAIAECRSFAFALFDRDGAEGEQITGQAAMGRELQALDAAVTADNGADSQADHCTVWAGLGPDAPVVLLVRCQGRRLWVACDPEQLEACIACWANALGSPD